MLVGDILSGRLLTVTPQMTVREAAQRMRGADVGAVPVLAGSRLLGVLTDRDIVLRCVAAGRSPEQCRVVDILTPGVVTVAADTPLDEAARLMAQHRIRRLPVTRSGRLVGMISLGDLALRHPLKQGVAAALEGVSQTRRKAQGAKPKEHTSKLKTKQANPG